MNYNEQTDALYIELSTLIKRFTSEFDLNISTIIGVLEEKKLGLILQTVLCGYEPQDL